VSGPIATIDVVVAEDLSGHLRRQEVHLVGGLRAAEDSRRRATVVAQISTEAFRRTVKSVVP
jgi:hypothetical protein